MTTPTLSYAELEALNDVLEAARCHWHPRPATHERAAGALRLVNALYWRLGRELPRTGEPSGRLGAVHYSSDGGAVDTLVELILGLTRDYAISYDPWWADTVLAPPELRSRVSPSELRELTESLQRMGITLEFRDDVPRDRLVAVRRDVGPWPDLAE